MVSDTDKHNPSLSICLVAHFAYGAMAGGDSSHIGGVERQTSLISRWFAARGHRVSMLTWDEGQEDGAETEGVRLFKLCRKDAGLPGLRFFWPRWTSLNAAMRRADADVYYHNCGEYVTGQVALWCRRHGRKFVYSVASDPDCDPALPEMRKMRERVLYRYGLRHADSVVVQTRRQQDMLREGFTRDSVVIPMPCPGPSGGERQLRRVPPIDSHRVLWIGRVCEVKRPDRLLDLAQRCPDLVFDFVGPTDGTAYSDDMIERAEGVPNLIVHGPASRNQVASFYQKAAVLCCTSDVEGFPNTFLEAWSHGTPVVSMFDPDNLISQRGLGVAADDVSQLETGIRRMLNSPEQFQCASQAAREYYLANHTVDAVMSRFERLFLDVVRTGGDSEVDS